MLPSTLIHTFTPVTHTHTHTKGYNSKNLKVVQRVKLNKVKNIKPTSYEYSVNLKSVSLRQP